ncbi:MAG: efflux RND transporter periplasmic adaptor subunit [Acidobacteria bacterium]|nr:efflux RND transporter periplasmic adaptor subunit [Acidobacteriota bacterium]
MSREVSALFLLSTTLLAACGGTTATPAAQGGMGAMPPADVQTVTLAATPIAQTSEYVGTVRSLRSTTVQPQVEGIVRQIFVKAGDRVRAGQQLLQIDPDRQAASLNATESQKAARESELAFARQQLQRMQKLHDAGAVSRAELEQAENAQRTAEAHLAVIESQIRETRLQVQDYRVRAPGPGSIGEIPVRQGARVTPQTAITTIDQAEGLEVYVNVPLERATALKTGLPVELLGPDGEVLATNPVTFIAPRADDATQSVLVKAQLRQVPPGTRVMQYVRARIEWNNDPALSVPVVAVSRVSGQYFVFVAAAGEQGTVARQTPVTLGDVIGDAYLVRGGVKAGDKVIVSNLQKIGDGAPVKPVS